MQKNLKVNGERLWLSLMEMAEIGATPKGGVCRLALTSLDKQARDLFARWCAEAGCTITVDAIGNIFARRAGSDESLPPIMTGSHLDSQPTGGKFDGAYGVMAGLEVLRTLNDLGIKTKAPVEAVVWTNEEGSRFAPSMTASGVFAGKFSLDFALGLKDTDGITMGEALEKIGYAGKAPVGGRKVGAFFEVHIEQGPILETEQKTIGVVTGAQGQRWYDVVVTGLDSHAGTTPMPNRRDAMAGAARMIACLEKIAKSHAPYAVSTVGMLKVHPNSRNVVPGQVYFSADLRHPDAGTLAAMDHEMRLRFQSIAIEQRLELSIEQISLTEVVRFEPDCINAVRAAATRLGYAHRDIVSGAGHDACYMSKVAPTAMIFVPCENGLSHNEIENATPSDVAAGCEVLLHAILDRAGIAQ
ncbi:MAG TPA: Zn-dependent hydrolase [Alphaproteobacteria bacterium]|nr:Zn-dependent hydrolase [Alphaproteobacteria bacterium]